MPVAILECKLLSMRGRDGENGRSFDVTYRVVTSCCVGPNWVLDNASCLPDIGDAYDLGVADAPEAGALCRSREVSLTRVTKGENGNVTQAEHDVVCRFESPGSNSPNNQPPGEQSQNPLDWCPRISFGSESREEPVEKAEFLGLYVVKTHGTVTPIENCLGCTETSG